ncbi:MAG: hypothetical protein R8L07_07110 [Alphaproteobacteria bacterium]|nr:hypothetical protein [Alphaproteobacteria bacterium]
MLQGMRRDLRPADLRDGVPEAVLDILDRVPVDLYDRLALRLGMRRLEHVHDRWR